MKYILIVLAACLLALLTYLFMVRGRKGHPGLENLRGWNYAHRGLHNENRPENSMAAFRAALEHGYGIELDVHLLKDGNLAVIHDSDLKRTTGAEGKIEDLTTQQLSLYHLEGTDQTIPTFREVLDLYLYYKTWEESLNQEYIEKTLTLFQMNEPAEKLFIYLQLLLLMPVGV